MPIDVTIIFPSIRTDEYYEIAKSSIVNQSLKSIQLLEDRIKRKNNADSMNACLDKAQGELITFAYDDDINMTDNVCCSNCSLRSIRTSMCSIQRTL